MKCRWAPMSLGAALVVSCSTPAHLTKVGATPTPQTSVPAPTFTPSPAAPTQVPFTVSSSPQTPVTTSAVPHPNKVLLIVEENHSATDALSGMPNLAATAHTYGYATNALAASHPSLPNYLALAGGSTFGITDDDAPPSHPVAGQSVFDQAVAAGKSTRVYAESMSSNCQQRSSSSYGVRHNPWTYFSDASSRTNCNRYDVPSGSTSSGPLLRDTQAGELPTVGMLVPNVCNDAHDCPLTTADSWLSQWLTVIRKGPDWNAGRLAIVVTFDENDGGSPNNVLTVVISTRTTHVVTDAALTHYSWTRYADELLGAPPLRGATTATSLRTPFGL